MGSIGSRIRKADMQTTTMSLMFPRWTCWDWGGNLMLMKKVPKTAFLGCIVVHKFRYIDRLCWLDDHYSKSKIAPTKTNLYTVVKTKTCLYFKDQCKHLVNFFGRLSRPKLPEWKLFPSFWPWGSVNRNPPHRYTLGPKHMRCQGKKGRQSSEETRLKSNVTWTANKKTSINFMSPQGIGTAMPNVNSIAVLPRFLLEYSSPARGTSKTWQWGHWAPGSTIN